LLDLRGRESRKLLEQVQLEWPDALGIGFGIPRSEPFREAEQSGVYATVDVNLERQSFQGLVGRALDHLHVLEESLGLRADASTTTETVNHAIQPLQNVPESSFSLLRFPRGFRTLETPERLLDRVVESLVDSAKVTRLGVFARRRPGETYRLQAG